MRNDRYKKYRYFIAAGAFLLTLSGSVPVCGAEAEAGSLLTVTEEAQILPIPDESGSYLLKSDGFYCLGQEGGRHEQQAVHFFEDFSIDGSVFDGYYYHDETGKFRADSPHMIYLPETAGQPFLGEEVAFGGYYMAGNLGKLTAAPQVRYLAELKLNKEEFNGFYFFNEYGELQTDAGIHPVHMNCNGRSFDGYYYFGGENGALLSEAGLTPYGLVTDETGKFLDLDKLGIDALETQLTQVLSTYEGEWSVYVKNLDTEEEFAIHDSQMYSASLIKAFVLAKTWQDMEQVQAQEGTKMKLEPDSPGVVKAIEDLLWNMITVSDNESFNELVRLQTESMDFKEGAQDINEYLNREGYEATSVQHTLSPSKSPSVGIGGKNTTSVKDCGLLLERIYKGECVSQEASEEMLNLLLNQQVTGKIPQGLDEDIVVANKTGETDTSQHDIAIVYGESVPYILCVMSENCPEAAAVGNIQDISRMVYNYLNLYEQEPENQDGK